MTAEPPQNTTRNRRRAEIAHRRVGRAMPHLVERVLGDIPPEALTPVEAAAREWRLQAVEDLGGAEALTATQEALLNAATGSVILLASLDAYLFTLATQEGLVNKRSRRAFAIVQDRMRVADSLARQLQGLGLERRAKPVADLQSYLASRYADRPEDSHEAAPEDPGSDTPNPAEPEAERSS